MKRIGLRMLCIAAVVTLSVAAFYPPDRTINLGLDLKGGVGLVATVHTDDVLRLETEGAAERVRESLTKRGATFTRIEATAPGELVVEGVEDEGAFREATLDVESLFERATEGAGAARFRIKPAEADRIRQDTLDQVMATIERRVNALGVVEPAIARYGTHNQIDIQLPGATDVEDAIRIISATAQLRLALLDDSGPFATRDAALASYGGALPPDLELLPGQGEAVARGDVYYAVHKTSAATGADLRDVRPSRDQFNRPAVAFTLKSDAAERFGRMTAANVNRRLATVLDKRVSSFATILGRIEDRGQIAGLTPDEMRDQVITLKSGALPASISIDAQHTVGPSLGQDSIRAGLLASVTGLGFVAAFMLLYYRRAGLNALVSIVLNLVILLGLLTFIGATMTLPGIAGFLLTIGMGVDSNVLIFERIKEERSTARSARGAVNAGFSRVWLTIVDTHMSSLIAAAFLFQFGTAPIRGFATTLAVGLLANVFTAVFVSRTLFELILSRRNTTGQALSI